MVSITTFALLLVAGFSATEVYSATQVKIEDYGYVAQIETGLGGVWLQTCVGSILTSRHLVTAAHCLLVTVVEPRISQVRVGAQERGRGGETFAVEYAIRHPTYNFLSFDGNVGIIRLQSSLVFGSTVQRITIPVAGVVFPEDVSVSLTGWGRSAQDVIWADRDLYTSEMYTTNHSDCVAKYGSLRIPIKVTDNMICFTLPGTTGTHVGLRDGGAPIQYNGVLVGFTSFGSPYGKNYPMVATGLSPYSDWIVENAV